MIWQIKAAIGLSVLLLLVGAFFTFKSLTAKIDDLETKNTQLEIAKQSAEDTVAENERMNDIQDKLSNLSSKQRIVIEKRYQSKLDNVDTSIREGKDREVGPLLLEFFNKTDE